MTTSPYAEPNPLYGPEQKVTNDEYVPVSDAELARLWSECRSRSYLQNGMTHHILSLRYKGHVEHRMGVGWFKSATVKPLTYAAVFAELAAVFAQLADIACGLYDEVES